MNNHAKNERDLASLVAQETLEDMYGGIERTYNVPGLLVGLGLVFLIVATLSLIIFWIALQ